MSELGWIEPKSGLEPAVGRSHASRSRWRAGPTSPRGVTAFLTSPVERITVSPPCCGHVLRRRRVKVGPAAHEAACNRDALLRAWQLRQQDKETRTCVAYRGIEVACTKIQLLQFARRQACPLQVVSRSVLPTGALSSVDLRAPRLHSLALDVVQSDAVTRRGLDRRSHTAARNERKRQRDSPPSHQHRLRAERPPGRFASATAGWTCCLVRRSHRVRGRLRQGCVWSWRRAAG
jgi:hypothetical protein